MMHGIILTLGGIPLLYLGDEIAQLNDYGYRLDPPRPRQPLGPPPPLRPRAPGAGAMPTPRAWRGGC